MVTACPLRKVVMSRYNSGSLGSVGPPVTGLKVEEPGLRGVRVRLVAAATVGLTGIGDALVATAGRAVAAAADFAAAADDAIAAVAVALAAATTADWGLLAGLGAALKGSTLEKGLSADTAREATDTDVRALPLARAVTALPGVIGWSPEVAFGRRAVAILCCLSTCSPLCVATPAATAAAEAVTVAAWVAALAAAAVGVGVGVGAWC
mmetsp:Transcript_33280/g.65361  ORF Transcript_33280/g.65361 Transcript_33280/m.65361 type:complete len:208 (-) Transcript_33280:368-991(-)